MLNMLTGGSNGLTSSAFGLGILAIFMGIWMQRSGHDGWFVIIAGSVAVVLGMVFASVSKIWSASTPEYDAVKKRAPYDRPASLSPRNDSYMRMIDPDRDRPRHF